MATQYHPAGIILPEALRRKPVPELARTAGANLLNSEGQAFTDPMLTRKKLCDAIVRECLAGRGIKTDDGRIGVWLNTPRIEKINGAGYIEERFGELLKNMLAEGHDMRMDPVLVYPIAHYTLGGIRITPEGKTSREAIFAAGESTWGVHGNDRLMGNSLLEVFVFGRVTGQAAAGYAREQRAG